MNVEQKTAAINIIEKKNGPVPYILDGPPGTGKTQVLVATVEELVLDTRKNNYVLICAQSNAACNELFERLLSTLRSNEILRLYAVGYDYNNVKNEGYLQFSNWDNRTRTFTMPELKFLYSFRVLVCTLAVAGNLTRANMNPSFKPDHFSHVIIDESACAHETITMIPIAGEMYFITF